MMRIYLYLKNGVSSFSSDKKNNKLYTPFTILFNGCWLERKGIHVLVKAAQLLYEQDLNIHYLLIGTGGDVLTVLSDWPKYLRSFVEVVPYFNQRDESDFLAKATLFVLPSYFEGQPLSLLQAMAANKCCITTNCCGQKDIIKNGKTGFLFSMGDHNELAILIKDCFYNQERIRYIGANATQYVQNITWEKVSNEVVEYVSNNS